MQDIFYRLKNAGMGLNIPNTVTAVSNAPFFLQTNSNVNLC